MMKIKVTGGAMSVEEQNIYVDYIREKYPERIFNELEIHMDGEYIDLKYQYDVVPFERIRRITGYLVGTLGRFNNAKRAEVEDRVKHG